MGRLLQEAYTRALWLLEGLGQTGGRDREVIGAVAALRETFERCELTLGLSPRRPRSTSSTRVGGDRGQTPMVRGAALGATLVARRGRRRRGHPPATRRNSPTPTSSATSSPACSPWPASRCSGSATSSSRIHADARRLERRRLPAALPGAAAGVHLLHAAREAPPGAEPARGAGAGPAARAWPRWRWTPRRRRGRWRWKGGCSTRRETIRTAGGST